MPEKRKWLLDVRVSEVTVFQANESFSLLNCQVTGRLAIHRAASFRCAGGRTRRSRAVWIYLRDRGGPKASDSD